MKKYKIINHLIHMIFTTKLMKLTYSWQRLLFKIKTKGNLVLDKCIFKY